MGESLRCLMATRSSLPPPPKHGPDFLAEEKEEERLEEEWRRGRIGGERKSSSFPFRDRRDAGEEFPLRRSKGKKEGKGQNWMAEGGDRRPPTNNLCSTTI